MRRWPKEDENLLRKEYSNKGPEIEPLLKKYTKDSIRTKAWSLRLRVRKEVHYAKIVIALSKKISKRCLTCGKKFNVSPCRKETAKFCSFKCYYRSIQKNNWIKVECFNCGEGIERRKSKIKYHNRQFCSLKCYHEFNRGKNHCRWTGYDFRHTKEWEEVRKRILERDGYKCFLTRKIDSLCIHHIIPWRKIRKNLDSYLITLTRSSHIEAEEELKHFRRENNNGLSPLQIKFLSYTGELQYLES